LGRAAGELIPEKYDDAGDEVEVERLECPEEPDRAGVEELLGTDQAEGEDKQCEEQDPEFPKVRDCFEKARQRESWLPRILFGEDLALHVTAVGDEKQYRRYEKAGWSGFSILISIQSIGKDARHNLRKEDH
jgi:hypothetical protein